MARPSVSAGFFGKLPCNGDFVQRRVDAAFVDGWDRWLQQRLHAARQQRGGGWDAAWQSMAPWRFALAPGVCGARGYAGVFVSSVDRVGRQFPLAVVRPLDGHESALAVASGAQRWFEDAEALLRAGSDSLERFDRCVAALATPATSAGAGGIAALEPASYWWTLGARTRPPCWLACQRWPQDEMFAFMLGAPGVTMSPRPERHSPAYDPEPAADADVDTQRRARPLAGRSAAWSSAAGRVLVRDTAGLWALAATRDDGDAGRVNGLLDDLRTLPRPAPIAEFGERVRRQLGTLQADVTAPRHAARGSSVAVLALDGPQAALLWSGTCSVHRWRAGTLLPLTELPADDEAGDELVDAGDFGDLVAPVRERGATTLRQGPELRIERVLPGDRFVLCAGGVPAPADLAVALSDHSENDAEGIGKALVAGVSSADAKDRVAVVVVDIGVAGAAGAA